MPPYSLRRLLWGGPAATLVAVLANLAYFRLTRSLGGQYLLPLNGNGSQTSPMPVMLLVIVTLVTGLLAILFFGLLVRFAHKPATIFLSVAVAALVLSFGGPFNLPGASLRTSLILSGMNILAAAVITGGILLLSHQNVKTP